MPLKRYLGGRWVEENTLRIEKEELMVERHKADFSDLHELYHVQKLSLKAIGTIKGCCAETVGSTMMRIGISRRPPYSTVRRCKADFSDLYDLYVVQKMSLHEIGRLKGCCGGTVGNTMRRMGVARRSPSEGQRLAYDNLLGKRCPNWKGGRTINDSGYVLVYAPNHPHAYRNRYVLEHRLVMEAKLGRYLSRTEHVHHRNEVRDDNREENLELMSRRSHKTRELECRGCPMRKEVRLLRWQIKELTQALQTRMDLEGRS